MPNTLYGPTPTDPSSSTQSTLPTLIAHNYANIPSTLAHQTSQPPPNFDFPNPQPNTKTVHEPPRTHPMITRSQSGIVKPIDHLSLHTSSISPIPKNLSHALKGLNWRYAMYDEYNALAKNGTWLLVPRPAGVNMVHSMWLFKHKFHVDRTLSCYKARLPPGFVDNRYPHRVYLLQRSLYGLKQTPHAWFQRFAGSINNEFDMTVLGALNYFLAIFADRTPTEISYAFQQIFHYMHDPREPHLAALNRILRYVQGTLDLGLHLYASSTTSLVGYTDVGGLSIYTAEAEYRGVANVVAETTWLRNLLRELHFPLSTSTLVYCDNVSAVYMSSNLVQNQQTKHIRFEIHFVRDMITAGQVRVLHVTSRFQYADIFTKGLRFALFEEF
nr:ribonuclease H-like domain-containing protein [Tanacetum cinerariifolium]